LARDVHHVCERAGRLEVRHELPEETLHNKYIWPLGTTPTGSAVQGLQLAALH
jgi:hypothetical protein